MFKKVAVALAAAGLLTTAACGAGSDSGSSKPGDKVTIDVATSLTAADAPFLIGSQQGLFAKHNLDVQGVPMQGWPPALAALSNNSVQMVMQSPFAMAAANQKGSDLRFFCGSQKTMWNGFIVAADSGLPKQSDVGYKKAVEALKGKKIGVSSIGSTTEIFSNAILESVGMKPDDVTYVAVGYGEGAITALTSHKIDAILTYPFLTQQAAGRTYLDVDLPTAKDPGGEGLYNTMSSGWFAPKQWLDAHADAAHRFCQAYQESVDFLTNPANLSQVQQLVSEKLGLKDPALIKQIVTDPKGGLASLSSDLSCDALTKAIKLGVEYDQVKAQPKQDCGNLIWNKIQTP